MRETTEKLRGPQANATGASRTVIAWAQAHWQGYVAAVAAGVFLAVSGAFGTINAPLFPRTVYWITLMVTGATIGWAAAAVLQRQPRVGDSRWKLLAQVTLAVTAPMTPFVWLTTGFLFQQPYRMDALPYFFGAVLTVSLAMSAIMMQLRQPGPATIAAPVGAPSRAPFLNRLPAKLMGGALWAVEAEDHYLRVRTSRGSDLILMRLGDALKELDGIEGAQVHRSWWVAREGVAEITRDGARVTLRLKDGSDAPVSRPNVKALRDAGWF